MIARLNDFEKSDCGTVPLLNHHQFATHAVHDIGYHLYCRQGPFHLVQGLMQCVIVTLKSSRGALFPVFYDPSEFESSQILDPFLCSATIKLPPHVIQVLSGMNHQLL